MTETRRPVPKIGVDMLFVAPVLKDDETGTQYGTPIRLSGLSSIGYDPATQSGTYDADDGTYCSYSADGTTTATIKVADLLSEHYALMLGVAQSDTGVLQEGTADNPPEMALGFRSQKSDGSYRFVWILKGKFAKSAESYATKSGSGVTYNDRELVFTALNRMFDNQKRHQLDSDDVKLPVGVTLAVLSNVATGWFSNPDYVPTASGTPISNLVATTGATAGTIDLTFSAPAGAAAVRAEAEAFGSWVKAATTVAITAQSTTATITGLTAGNSYKVRLVVVSGANNGISNEQTAKAKATV